jgi:hypothetical protein
VNSFYAKYVSYPGDFAVASGTTGEWGSGTSYGDGNGRIEFVNTATTAVYEGYRLWQHLSLAGMLSNPYVGTQTTAAAVLGTDVPQAKIGGGGYLFDFSTSTTAYNGTTAGAYGFASRNVMLLGAPLDTPTAPVQVGGVLTPDQAMGVDTKMDDGVPTTGNVLGASGVSAGTCISGAVYSLVTTDTNCIMVFATGIN